MTQTSAQGILRSSDSTALALGFTGTLGNIDAYISAVNRLPMLTQEEEIDLATKLVKVITNKTASEVSDSIEAAGFDVVETKTL